MSVKVIVGLQWGDEGKGKIADILSCQSDLVVRYQGGNNAGHTVVIGNDKYIFHLIPSGILRKGLTCLISRGTVIDPNSFLEEIDILSKKGISCKNRLFISEYAHVVFPYHRLLDEYMDSNGKTQKIGTTRRGIGPCYADKFYRTGIRMKDLISPEILRKKIKLNLDIKNKIITKIYNGSALNPEKLFREYSRYGDRIKPYIKNCQDIIREYLEKGKNILYEGAQGTLLDIDYGTYPFVTSSNTCAAGIFTSGELFSDVKKEVIGILKAYTTRVGEGPFPTECEKNIAEDIRKIGDEYGASTGRPRRCGWFDAVAGKYSCDINGVKLLVLTKLDVLDKFKEIKICTGYKYKNKMLKHFPASSEILYDVKAVYETMSGWNCSTKGIENYKELPVQAKKYISRLEEILNRKINMISTGYKRKEFIQR